MTDARAVEVNGTTITYIEAGTGSPLLLVHGAFADFRYWQAGLSCAEVAAIRAPALLLIGADTPPYNRDMMRGVQSCVPGIETIEVEGASHNIHFDNPAEFSRAVLNLVGRH